ncbi:MULTISPECIES: flagellar hook-basal body complex protein FliE [Borrelia]|uniref:Flagellar hook-basal body complex protein FliE n=2 Tax=Borrelia turicatae TaxID=142 RepID=A0A172XAS4_BORTU|nr:MULTISPECIES: flagellar hook-basal body complex protein FliE [Borrelia]AAX17630.1 flagellar hook-basal body complex protein FliE [Borrelia turicatae 91E135]ANF33784.1 flagellar hook-basal body complex protein FliE [Borrelia turicatae]UPA11978.1 flagellar hook-basal body complex protein FliE [Borrelia venezuelensis]UPA13152.1 flagellar hook-basal body complex protein FliE [Borrelia turicatae 91E135]UPA14637.1 flagellar hook-basal body complex protein FliE [Borrelia turicatae]
MEVDSFFTDNNVYLVRKNPLHFDKSFSVFDVKREVKAESFKDLFLNLISDVNNSQLDVSRMSQQAILQPNSVDVHDITIAMAKANMNLSITKAVVERSIKAYQDVINIR